MKVDQELFDAVEVFQNELLSFATGGGFTLDYEKTRESLIERFGDKVPRFIRLNRNGSQLWQHFKQVSGTYQGRRNYIYKEFEPLLNELEGKTTTPGDEKVANTLAVLSSATVQKAWETALERRADDPDGAITAARTLLETVCKHLLDDLKVEYAADEDLPKLFKLTIETLGLAPNQQTSDIMRQILGGCTSIVNGVGALRNKMGDAHGKGKTAVEPESRHAELAVNIAGAIATFLVQSLETSRN